MSFDACANREDPIHLGKGVETCLRDHWNDAHNGDIQSMWMHSFGTIWVTKSTHTWYYATPNGLSKLTHND